ncbi:hypothetical protein J6590_080035 [Homalodisca vitripennis]|nr:hypothetical protein J6590_080035 [Homalodisca vitripennis]
MAIFRNGYKFLKDCDSFIISVLFSPCLSSQLPCPVPWTQRIHLSAQCCSALSILTAPLSSTMDTADSFVSSVLFSSVCPHSSPVQYIADSFVSSVLFSPCLSPQLPCPAPQLPCPVHSGFIRQLSVVQPLSIPRAPLSSTMDTADSFVSSVLFSHVCPHSSPVQYTADSFVSSVLFSPVCPHSSPVQYHGHSGFICQLSVVQPCLSSQLPCPVHSGFICQLSVVQPCLSSQLPCPEHSGFIHQLNVVQPCLSVLFSPVCPHSSPVQYHGHSGFICQLSVVQPLSFLTAPLSSTTDTADSFVSSVLFSPVCPHSSPVQYIAGSFISSMLFSPVCPHSSPVQYIAGSFVSSVLFSPVCPHSSPVQYTADSFVSSVLFSPVCPHSSPCPVHSGFIRQLSVVQPLSVLTAPLSST